MVAVAEQATRGLLALDVAVLCGVAAYAASKRDEPGAIPFCAATVTLAVAAAFVAVLGRIGGPRSLSWAVLASLLLVFVTCWLWFVLTYTGEWGYASERWVNALAVVPAVGVLTLAYLYVSGDPIPRLPTATGPFYVVFFSVPTLFVGALFLGSVLSIVRAGLRYASADFRRSVALAVGALGGGVLPLVFISLEGSVGTNPARGFAVAGLVSAAGFGLATVRYELFESVPVAEAIGRDRLVAAVDDLVIVVDGAERVVDLNRAAESALDVDLETVVGDPVQSLCDVPETLTDVETVELEGDDGRHVYEASVSDVSDDAGRVVGHALVLRDVTDRQTRRQRLEVLNRVLRHNLRNDMTTVMGYADLMADDPDEAPDFLERIHETADALTALGDKAREIERIMAASDAEDAETDATRIVQYVAAEARKQYPDAEISVDLADEVTVAAPDDVLWPIVWNLVENAIEHNDDETASVTIRTRTAEEADRAVIAVIDDGPGIPVNEREAIDTGTERPLAHGSGLGLWAVKWGANRVGGDVTIEEAEPDGARVTVRLPLTASTPNHAAENPEQT